MAGLAREAHRSSSGLGCFSQSRGCGFTPKNRGVSQLEGHRRKSHGYLKPRKPKWPEMGNEEGAQEGVQRQSWE